MRGPAPTAVTLAALTVLGLAGCKGKGDGAPRVTPAPVADAAVQAVAVDAAPIDGAPLDAPGLDAVSGPVTLGLCPAITAVLAAQDSWLQALRGADTGWRGLPRATLQLEGADAALYLRPDDRAGDWTARRAGAPGLVEGWIAEAAACPPIADWYQVAASPTNHSWQRDNDIARQDDGVTMRRSLEVWIAGGKGEAWVTISVIDQEFEPGD